MDEKELLEIVEQAAKEGRTELDLSKKNITTLPPEIGSLKDLTTLNLSYNLLISLPAQIGDLKNLNTLYLNNNHLKSVPPEIGNLKNLSALQLKSNQLSSLPPEIGDLSSLTMLNLNDNYLSSLPLEIGNLKNLTWLYLAYNALTSLPVTFRNLKDLTTVWLTANQLTHMPDLTGLTRLMRLDLSENQICKLPKEALNLRPPIKWMWTTARNGVFLQGNPFERPPIEIVKQGNWALKNYFKSVETEEVVRVYEAKLLIVGEGGVGKTCMMKRLMAPDKVIDQNELATEGIEINRWIIQTPKAKSLRINIWDFGGQEIYHATHQFFLTKRSLYLFVWTARMDDDLTSFDYWINAVKLLSDSSPVIVVLNKIDQRIKTIDEQSLQCKFGNIVCFDRVSALKGTGIQDLAAKITQNIAQLPHIGDVLPTVWVDIRRRLEALDKNYISFYEYRAICSEFGLDQERAQFLSRYYHDLGVFLHFLDNPLLKEIVFLKPEWATNAVYKVVDTREIQESYGAFDFEQLKCVWRDYPEDKFVHLLELMKKFELCFQIPGTQTYIVPELLRPAKPPFEWDYANNLRCEYRYEFMPAGIMTRFIVRIHDIIKEDIYWKNGVILERENTEALVISERLNRKISIWVRGVNRKELVAIIRREIDYIHKTLNNPDVKEMIPCICSECEHSSNPYFHDFTDLMKAEQRFKKKIECKKSFEHILIKSLLGDYEWDVDKERVESLQEKYPLHVEVNPHIEVSPTIEQKPVVEQYLRIDLYALAQQLQDLRKIIRSKSDDSLEVDVAAGEIAKAEKAAKEGDYPLVIKHLKAAGKWAFDFATSVGSSLVAEAIKKSMGM